MTIYIDDKNKLLKYIKLYKHLFFIKFKTNSKDKELVSIINILNIKSRYKRIKYIVEETSKYIDNHYKGCTSCKFINNQCICYRKQNKKEINGCCNKCLYQSNKGCTTENIACKLFNCSYTKLDKLNIKDIKILKLLNNYQIYVLKNDYFTTKENIIIDLYVGPICLLIRLIIRYIIYFIKVFILKELSNENINNR